MEDKQGETGTDHGATKACLVLSDTLSVLGTVVIQNCSNSDEKENTVSQRIHEALFLRMWQIMEKVCETRNMTPISDQTHIDLLLFPEHRRMAVVDRRVGCVLLSWAASPY